MFFYFLILLIIFQRLLEMRLSRQHFNLIKDKLLISPRKKELFLMLALHSLFFISSLVEFSWRGSLAPMPFLILGSLILIFCQLVRFKTMKLLGVAWTTFPISFKEQQICSKSLYRYVRHPNYLIVIIEIFLIPLLGKCYYTSIIFGVLNFIFLIRRIKVEEAALSLLPEYSKVFSMKKKLIPFLYLFFLVNFAHSKEITVESKSFEDAQKQESYFKFIGESKKFGLISTSFEGYAKKFTLSYDEKENFLQEISLLIDLKKLDTDNDSRNEKMWDLCLNTKEFPSLKIKIEKLSLSEETQTLVTSNLLKLKFLTQVLPSLQSMMSFKLSF